MVSPASPAPWLFLQLIDGAFPAGGFAHSAGLEAAVHLRGVPALEAFFDEAVRHAASTTLPFVREACETHDDIGRIAALDALFDATCTSHVANRASRAQGRALVAAMRRVFERDAIARIAEHASERGPAHHAPMLRALFGTLGVTAREAQMAWLHGLARGLLSAAVRLGVVGPLEAQQIQAERAALLEEVLADCMHVGAAEVAQTAPLVELFGALHERLDGRLFQS